MVGKLKDAKIVRLSRTANSARLIFGMLEVADEEPNILANWLSLYMPMLMFTVDVAANLAGPAVTWSAFLFSIVLVKVSMVFAVK